MTEAEWLPCEDPKPMIGVIRNRATERKIRLLALSCCWRNEYLLVPNEEHRQMDSETKRRRRAIAVLESWIEGLVSERDQSLALKDAINDAFGEIRDPSHTAGQAVYAALAVFDCILRSDWEGVVTTASEVPAFHALTRSGNPDLEKIAAFRRIRQSGQGEDRWWSDTRAVQALPEYVSALRVEQSNQANLLRDIVGNPFRPVAFSSSWRTYTAITLAQTIYDSRDFSAMPILADALQDAGCDNEEILNHCRDTNATHVRGCWVVDLILSKDR